MTEQKPKFGLETYPAGAEIIHQGDVPDKFYLLTSGEVEVVRHYPGGQEVIIDRLGAGCYFGEIGLLKKAKRVATVRANSDVQVMAMSHATFESWLSSSAISREEIDAVMQERLESAGELQPLDSGELGEEETAVPATAAALLEAASPAIAGQQTFAPGEIIIHQGDTADQFYIIVEGNVEVFNQPADAPERIIARLENGSYFGEIGLLEGSKRTASVRAATPTRLLVFDRDTFSRWLTLAPASRYELWRTAHERRDNTKPLPPIGGIPSLDVAQMIEVDRAMVEEYHIQLIQMMENAGRHLAHLSRTRFLDGDPQGKQVAILAGRGNNGGGGLVCARYLRNWGADVQVFVTHPDEHFSGIPAHQLEILRRMGVPITIGAGMLLAGLQSVDLIVDALIGYGLVSSPQGACGQFVRWANDQNCPILSLDIPTGLDATTGKVHDPAIRASATLTLALPKDGLRHEVGSGVVGELYLADIGVPSDLYAGPRVGVAVGPIFAKEEIIRLH
jgi:NAD(P)H-hydrate epimerase